MIRGIVEDETYLTNMVFGTVNEAIAYLERAQQPNYRIILNLPPGVDK